MKKLSIAIFILFFFFSNVAFAKKEKPLLILTSKNPAITKASIDGVVAEKYFKKNSKIYFIIYNPNGFKSDYIKYQIVKQDDLAHVGGFTRARNVTKRVKDKNFFSDYFTLGIEGKYFIQIFDIENLQHWLAIESFRVVND